MRLLSLQVKGVSCFRNPVKLEAFDPHINIIYGPNEVGKSTLITSLARAFFDKSNTRGQEIESLRPWGTSLSPEIVVEFVARGPGQRHGATRLIGRHSAGIGHGGDSEPDSEVVRDEGTRFRLEKGFLDNPYTRLFEWTESGYELLADGDRAEEIVRSMWRSTMPGRGATKVDHWGLARLLWFRQDRERFDLPSLPSLNDEALLNELRQTLDIMTISKEEEDLFSALDAELGRVVTSKQRNFAKGSRVLELQEQRDRLEAKIASLSELIDSVDDLSTRVSQLTESIDQRTRMQASKAEELGKLRDKVNAVRQLRNSLAVAKSELEMLQSRRDALGRDRDTIRQAKALTKQLGERLRLAQEQSQSVAVDLAECMSQIGDTEKKIVELSRRVQEAKSRLDRCRRIKQLCESAKELERKRSLRSKLEQLTGELRKTRIDLKSMSIPEEKDVQRAEELKARIAALEAQLEAVGMSFTVEAHADLELDFESDTQAERHSINAGQLRIMHASQEAVLTVPDLMTVTIRSGSGEAAGIQEKLSEMREEFKALLDRYSASSTADLHAAISKGERLRDTETRLVRDIKELGVNKSEDLDVDITQLEQKLRFGLGREGLDAATLQTIDAGDEDQLSHKLESVEREEARLQQQLTALRGSVSSHKELQSGLKSQIDSLSDQCAREQARMDGVLAAYGADEAKLEDDYSQACLQVDQKQAAIKAMESQLPSEDPEKQFALLEAELRRIDEDLRGKRDELSRTEGRLEQLSSGDLYIERNRAEEQLELTKRELHRETVRARALSLIRVLYDTHRQAMTAGLSAPIENRVTSYWEFVRSRAGVRARLGNDMELALLDTAGKSVDRDSFSAGAREQLYVVVRLAIAELLSERDRQVVVLDDALVFTDPYRHSRMLELIVNLSTKMQVLILTSHEGQFDSLPGARFDLAELRNRALLV